MYNTKEQVLSIDKSWLRWKNSRKSALSTKILFIAIIKSLSQIYVLPFSVKISNPYLHKGDTKVQNLHF